jgi:hypothetical protein
MELSALPEMLHTQFIRSGEKDVSEPSNATIVFKVDEVYCNCNHQSSM